MTKEKSAGLPIGNPVEAERVWKILLITGAVLMTIKNIFTNLDIDIEYAVATSYRILQGDRMFLQMWEPHQTSHFITTFFMGIYLRVLGSTAGMVIYLNTVGVLLHLAVTMVLRKALRFYMDNRFAFYTSLIFFCIRPKDILMPEFSNMFLWFSVLTFAVFLFYLNDNRKMWLGLAGLFLSLAVLSYPSAVCLYIVLVVILFLFSKERWKDIAIVTGVCGTLGLSYLLWCIGHAGGLGVLLESLCRIATADSSHSQTLGQKLLSCGIELLQYTIPVAVMTGILFVVNLLWKAAERSGRIPDQIRKQKHLCFLGLFLLLDLSGIFMHMHKFYYVMFYYPVFFFLLGRSRNWKGREKQLIDISLLFFAGVLTATFLLTNLSWLSIAKYPVWFIVVLLAFAGQNRDYQVKAFYALAGISVLVILRGGIDINPIDGNRSTVLDVGGIVKKGPAMGIVNNYFGVYTENASVEDFAANVSSGDSLLLVGNGLVNSLAYLYCEDVEVSIASTICTPTYDEKLLEYWENYPEKYPTVIAVDCWYGELHVDQDQWIMQWLEQQPYTYTDGKYWRFYRLQGGE